MLKMIEDFMEQNNEDPILTKQEAAEAFLGFVESKGMLPPEYIVEYGPLITANAWEPEE